MIQPLYQKEWYPMVTSNIPADNLHFDRAMIFDTMTKVGLNPNPDLRSF